MPDRTWSRYDGPAAFRDALEDRLSREAAQHKVPVNRLRKEAAFLRLLARLVAVDTSSWALKGGFALIARLGRHMRGTRDVDANWRAEVDDLEDLLTQAEGLDLDDWFRFEFGEARQMRGEAGGQSALRYPVICYLGNREFERLRLDFNLVGAADRRPTESTVVARNPFDFVGEKPLIVPMITPSQQLAEKLHAYVREYRSGTSSRPKDLYDSIIIAANVWLPSAGRVLEAAKKTFDMRDTEWPPSLRPPPSAWESEWGALVEEGEEPAVSVLTLEEAFSHLERFWGPLIRGELRAEASWSPDEWAWRG